MRRISIAMFAGLIAAACAGSSVAAPATTSTTTGSPALTIRVDTAGARGVLPERYLGLSFESLDLAATILDPANSRFFAFLNNLGPGRLRFGGNTFDRITAWVANPGAPRPDWASVGVDAADFQRLGRLAERTKWTVDLQVGLGHFDPVAAADEVAAAREALGPALTSVEIGNEPDLFSRDLRPSDYDAGAYATEVAKYRAAITARTPGIAFGGPDTARSPAFAPWFGQYLDARHATLAVATQHYYATTHCRGATTSISELLSDSIRARQQKIIDSVVSASRRVGLPARLDESNSTSCSGQIGVSDRFGSALWAVDYLFDAAARGIDGVNLHGLVAGCLAYSPVCADASRTLRARPIFYGMLLVAAAGTGKVARLATAPSSKVSAFAVDHRDGSTAVALVNRNPKATSIELRNRCGGAARLVRLTAPALGAAGGVTLGGASVKPDGTFTPRPQTIAPSATGYRVSLPASSAALLTIPPGSGC